MINLSQKTWNDYAVHLTEYLQRIYPFVHRGCVIVPMQDDERMFAVIFGNEEPSADQASVTHEVSLIREHLQARDIQDLGFGRSHDGNSWVLVSRCEMPVCQTDAGKRFQIELLRGEAEEAVLMAKDEINGS
jgi:hypothetical protein